MPAPRFYINWWGSTGGGGGGGSGTVTSVSVTTAAGVSGSVLNPTTTPAITITLGDITPTSVTISGTAGAGFAAFVPQSSAPAAPATGYVKYADATGRMAWRRASDGFVRTFDSTLTANRVFTFPDAATTIPIATQQLTFAGPTAARTITFPDAAITVARTDAAQSFTGLQTFVGGLETRNGTSGTQAEIFKTYSGAGANYESLRIDGGVRVASEFSIGTYNAGTGAAQALSIYGASGLWLEATANSVTLNSSGSIVLRVSSSTRASITTTAFSPQTANAFDVGASGSELRTGYFATSIVMSSAASLTWSTDANIVRSGAGNLALQNGASGCRWDVHNTTGANAEFGSMFWTTNVLVIGTDKAGSGTARAMSFMIGGASKWQINTSFHFIPISDNSFDFGATTGRIRNCYIGTAIGMGTGGNAVVLSAEGTGILQLGTDAGTPVTQRIKAFDGSGTSIQGSTLELCGGQSTGNVVGGSTVIKGSPAGGASNSTPNAYVDYITVTGAGDLQTNRTITAGGTTGAQTINKMQGSVNLAAGATSLVVTNSLVTASSTILLTLASNDTTTKSVAYVAASGSFTIYPDAAPTAETRVNFFVLN